MEKIGNPPSDGTELELPAGKESPARQGLAPTEETDVYVLLKGPAHILVEDGNISIAFLDETGNRKSLINLVPEFEGKAKVIKPLLINLIVECDKAKFENGELKDFFPTTFNEIIKTPENMPNMTSTGPPTGNSTPGTT